jgi:hypothetical protein
MENLLERINRLIRSKYNAVLLNEKIYENGIWIAGGGMDSPSHESHHSLSYDEA